jgi:L-malate glycosyltransferase
MTAVHQFHPTLAPGDAMSNHVFALRRRIRGWGYDSYAYAVEAKPGVADVRSYRRLFRDVRPADVLLIHFSMGHEVIDQLVKIPCRRVLVYHNITPPEFFSGINPHAAAHARLGLRQLARIAPAFELAIGVSEFNRRDLVAAGYEETATVPILLDWTHFTAPPTDAVLARWKGFRTVLLFVGRISPNKRQDDLVRLLAYYRRCIDPEAHLVLVGAFRDQPQYHARVAALIDRLGLGGAVAFAGTVDDASLLAYYRAASCFVSVSEHEGFGVPLLEAMRFRLPVVAYEAAAIGETVGDAGVLVKERDLAEIAETAALVNERTELRERLVAAGERRLEHFDPDRVADRTRQVLGL